MEPPASFEADALRNEKVKVLSSTRSIKNSDVIRAQYDGYLKTDGVAPNSTTPTFAAIKMLVDNWRWKDVPFYVRTGKRLAAKDTEIAITFKKVPHSMFVSTGLEDMPPNVLVFQIQPEEGISLRFQAKKPGSKLCMATLNMNFNYSSIFNKGGIRKFFISL